VILTSQDVKLGRAHRILILILGDPDDGVLLGGAFVLVDGIEMYGISVTLNARSLVRNGGAGASLPLATRLGL
jgi:hypothetical protein